METNSRISISVVSSCRFVSRCVHECEVNFSCQSKLTRLPFVSCFVVLLTFAFVFLLLLLSLSSVSFRSISDKFIGITHRYIDSHSYKDKGKELKKWRKNQHKINVNHHASEVISRAFSQRRFFYFVQRKRKISLANPGISFLVFFPLCVVAWFPLLFYRQIKTNIDTNKIILSCHLGRILIIN